MVKEALHWRAVDPVGLPHRSLEDDWYEGMFIPNGTIYIANISTAKMRHTSTPRNISTLMVKLLRVHRTQKKRAATSRMALVCADRVSVVMHHVTDNSLFINVATALWALKLERRKDPTGQLPLDVDGSVAASLVIHPVPYECDITPRFRKFPRALHTIWGSTVTICGRNSFGRRLGIVYSHRPYWKIQQFKLQT
ncbi:hypothetical protein EDB87DRAFT_1631041 [Lactarius vividus]|nr:hypothetical protein EDB87DRAFT_1631041 [Lactarius vividus]